MTWLRRSLVLVLIVVIFLVGLLVYLHQFSSSPQGVVEDFFSAYNHADIRGMVDCVEPIAEQLVNGGTDLASSLLGAFTGIDFDLGIVLDVMPAFSDSALDSTPQIPIENAQVVSYTPSFAPKLTKALVSLIPPLVNVMADDAIVSFQVSGTDVVLQADVVNYGTDGWRIPMDSTLFTEY